MHSQAQGPDLEPPRILFLCTLALGFLCAMAFVFWRTASERPEPRVHGAGHLPPETEEPREERITEEELARYSLEALRADESLRQIDLGEAFEKDWLPSILETDRFEQSNLGMTVGGTRSGSGSSGKGGDEVVPGERREKGAP